MRQEHADELNEMRTSLELQIGALRQEQTTAEGEGVIDLPLSPLLRKRRRDAA